jgi:IS1 family transposase
MEAGLREDAAFAELVRAVAHRERIDAKLAIYDDHWEGYEAALREMEAAVQAYGLALEALREARSHHLARP